MAGSARTGFTTPSDRRRSDPPWLGGAPILRQAYSLAAAAHGSTRRATDEHLFLDHVVDVGSSLYEAGFDEEVVAVGLLHDSVERGTLRAEGLEELMGRSIAGLVLVLSEDPDIASFELRKAGLRAQVERAGTPAVDVYAADKLSDMLGLQRGLEMHREGLEERMGTSVGSMAAHYRESVEMVAAVEPDSIFLPTLRMRLWKLENDIRRQLAHPPWSGEAPASNPPARPQSKRRSPARKPAAW